MQKFAKVLVLTIIVINFKQFSKMYIYAHTHTHTTLMNFTSIPKN